jgi:hypothetical protein
MNWELKTDDGRTVLPGFIAFDFRGRQAVIEGGQHPRHEGSSGRVYANGREYFPSVFNLKWQRIIR